MIAIAGHKTTIAKALLPLLPAGEPVEAVRTGPGARLPASRRWLFAQGLLYGLDAGAHNSATAGATFAANFLDVAAACDQVLAAQDNARIVVVGSESGFAGSYDQAYAAAKAGLHLYVETTRLGPHQQLVCVAPGIVADAGMTARRPASDGLARRAVAHPKRRFVTSAEVAKLVHFLLYQDAGYITGVVVRMNGGEHTWH